MLKWTSTYCKDIKLLFKVDDDSYLIPHRASKWLQELEKSNSWPKNSILGKLNGRVLAKAALTEILDIKIK